MRISIKTKAEIREKLQLKQHIPLSSFELLSTWICPYLPQALMLVQEGSGEIGALVWELGFVSDCPQHRVGPREASCVPTRGCSMPLGFYQGSNLSTANPAHKQSCPDAFIWFNPREEGQSTVLGWERKRQAGVKTRNPPGSAPSWGNTSSAPSPRLSLNPALPTCQQLPQPSQTCGRVWGALGTPRRSPPPSAARPPCSR